ncbi:DNA-directed RNA polymerase III subunit RPC6-like [Rhopilema esculentum]|uniref:DNA-directed RNA polymerase III subunit RPC6-like n=1 Tax=Rhopilema esculentum TaxID=499914 RepID=UPI0031D82F2B|eukprot:gene16186-7554_t
MESTENVTIKQESIDLVDLEAKIVELCRVNPNGIPDALVQQGLPGIPPRQRVTAINRLLSTGQIELLKSGSTLLYKFKDSQAASKTKGFESEEKLIYQIIEDSKNKGIWVRDIRFKCNLQMTQVTKIVKSLESKKLIKAVSSVAAGKKKVYMLYNLEPDSSVTGGAWFSDQDFESEFVDVLNQQCYKFLQQKRQKVEEMQIDPLAKQNASFASPGEVLKYISELGISKVALSTKDIETILNTLVFDGQVEKTVVLDNTGSGVQQKKLFKAMKPILPVAGLMRVPCGVCPVVNDCHEGGKISPNNCIYLKEWMDF